jgi:hypothetical protein
MNLANLSAASGRLRDAVDVLNNVWTETQVHWNDGNSRRLDEKQMRPLGIEVLSAYAAIQGLADVLARAERECGPQKSMDDSDQM